MAREHSRVLPGIDVLLEDDDEQLRSRSLAVLTGSGATTSDLIPTISALRASKRYRIVALFGAEHGVTGAEQAGVQVESKRDPETALPVYSLYGEHREPTAEMLDGVDVLLIDFVDAGLRYYTYAATVRAVLQAAARFDIQVVLLDRPNPLDGVTLEGPVTEPASINFVSAAQVPIRHGLTLGELARWMNEREHLGARLRVIPMHGWRRSYSFDDTGLRWTLPSPNIPTADTCLTYAATCLMEGTPVSEGRGTAQPFSVLGAPWIDGGELANYLNARALPGVRFQPTWFLPSTSKHAGQMCGGVQLHIHAKQAFPGVRTGLHILAGLRQLYPREMSWTCETPGDYYIDRLFGTPVPRLALERGDSPDSIVTSWQAGLDAFAEERKAYLLYEPAVGPRRTTGAISQTEAINARTADLDTLTPLEILRLISAEDATVPGAIARELPAIAVAVEHVVGAFRLQGRLIYAGAGTSGRLGVLDAAECPPTYGTDPSQVVALIAGGPAAVTRSVEQAEDDESHGENDVEALQISESDVLVGIAASGRTPYVVGAIRRARSRGAYTVALVGNADGPVAAAADLVIAPQTGPEVVAGSTRMKAGTAQKLILNMISTTSMVCTGHTYGNLMVNMRASNRKLQARTHRIVAQATGASLEEARQALDASGGEMKTAIVMLRAGLDAAEARVRLERAHGQVRGAV